MRRDEFAAIRLWAEGRVAVVAPVRLVLDGTECPTLGTAAVYAAYAADGTCLYVGSVHRPHSTTAMRSRLADHDKRVERWRTWCVLWVIPLADCSAADVRSIEGYVGLLLRPTQSQRLPRAVPLAPLAGAGPA